MVEKTGERLARLETKVDNIDNSITKLDKRMSEFISSAEQRFASKLTEKIVYGLCALILVAFITKLTGAW